MHNLDPESGGNCGNDYLCILAVGNIDVRPFSDTKRSLEKDQGGQV